MNKENCEKFIRAGFADKIQEIERINKKEARKLKRRDTLDRKEGYALSALKPLVIELATHGQEWTDSDWHGVELLSQVDEKNPFVIDGDTNETFRRATNFLLLKKGHNLDWVADQLLISSKIRNADFPSKVKEAKPLLINLIKSKNPQRFSKES